MTSFRVWAPGKKRVELVYGDRRVAMTQAGHGWWIVEIAVAGPGDRYGYSLDGGPVRPDPRSPSQPDGVEALSEVVDHADFPWSDTGWRGTRLEGSVLYELHVGTFTTEGTFDGVIERIPHLVELGVDAIEILPVASFPGRRGWGYDGVGLYAPQAAYGGPSGLKRLVDRCHTAGIGVVLDVVYNHLGPSGNHLGEFGPYFSDRHQTNWGDGINLDGPGSDEVRRFFVENALMWLRDFHIDGLRLDAIHALSDTSAVHFLEQLSEAVGILAAETSRPLFLIGESDLNDPRFVLPRSDHGYGLDAAWADEWHHAVHSFLTGERDGYYEDFGSLAEVAKAVRQAWVYDGVRSTHRQRTFGRSPAALEPHQFVVCTQNHDQIGNRAQGDRLFALVGRGRVMIASALLLTSPFSPMLFMGEEWGAAGPWQYFTDFDDPELAAAVTTGRRQEFASFGWSPDQVPDPQDPATFDRSILDWSETEKESHAEILDWYRALIRLRRALPEITDSVTAQIRVEVDPVGATIRMERPGVQILANAGKSDWEVPLPPGSEVILRSDNPGGPGAEAGVIVTPDSVVIVEVPLRDFPPDM